MKAKVELGLVSAICVFASWFLARVYQEIVSAYYASGTVLVTEFSWFFRMLLNLVGYSTVLVPMFIMYKYLHRINYFDKISNLSLVSRTLSACFSGGASRPAEARPPRAPESAAREGAELAFCFFGLMGAYLVWGLLQEKIMTQDYIMPDGSLTRFADSQFLVFINRLGALLAASARLAVSPPPATAVPTPQAPLYKFSYCALTNVMSAWCQYEALKYVNFPTQVLSKSCKLVPVLIMSALVSGRAHPPREYLAAAAASLGMVLFVTGSRDQLAAASSTMTLSGFLLLGVYLACDSFTSSWQAELFSRYSVTPIQMMCYVNIFSCLLPAAALLQAGAARSLSLLQHPMFALDCFMLSASSTVGQLLIYRTIARFGAVTFTIIMTLRQATSILLSCLVFGHALGARGAAGAALVLAAVLARVYCRHRLRGKQRQILKT